MTQERSEAPVRVTISTLDDGFDQPGTCRVDLDEPNAAAARERATAWAEVRGYDNAVPAIHRLLTGEPPDSGYAALINKPHQLLIMAVWPWAPENASKPTLPWG